MANELINGEAEGKCIKAEFGSNKDGKPEIRADMEVVGGPHAGKSFPYSGKLDQRNIKYTKQHMIALGWKGADVRTFTDDVAAAKLTVPITLRVATWNKPDGTVKQWTSVDRIGVSVAPLKAVTSKEIDDVNEWFNAADAVDAKEDMPF